METNSQGFDPELMQKLIIKMMKTVNGKPPMEIYLAMTYVLTVVIYECNEERHLEKRAEVFYRGLLHSIREYKIRPDKIIPN
jgi:hypothetical protein